MQELSQAEQKRRKQQKEALTYKLDRMLKDFENKFMDAYTTYNYNKVAVQAGKLDYPTYQEAIDANKGQSFAKLDITPTYCYTKRDRLEWKDSATEEAISREWSKSQEARLQISRSSLLSFGFMKEAASGWSERFDRLVLRVLSEAKSTERMALVNATSQGGELEILIQQQSQEFHCRFIWVDGVQVAPHHRFIVTTRKIKQ